MHYTINSSASTNDGPSGHYELQTKDYINPTGLFLPLTAMSEIFAAATSCTLISRESTSTMGSVSIGYGYNHYTSKQTLMPDIMETPRVLQTERKVTLWVCESVCVRECVCE